MMKPAEEWVDDLMGLINDPPIYKAGAPNVDVEQLQHELASIVERIQADALAAAQPEPRPLRELIAEGCEQFWVRLYSPTCAWIMCWLHDGWIFHCGSKPISVEDYSHRPAIPISKPTVTPHG